MTRRVRNESQLTTNVANRFRNHAKTRNEIKVSAFREPVAFNMNEVLFLIFSIYIIRIYSVRNVDRKDIIKYFSLRISR